VGGLQILELAEEGIVLSVGYLRAVEDVVPIFVMANESAKFLDALDRCLAACHRTASSPGALPPAL
jgi:hypothetical protein